MLEASQPSSNGDSTSPSLIRGIQSRNQVAWAEFVDRYGPLIVRWCRKYQLRDEDVQDIFQSVLEAVAKSIDSFSEREPGSKFRKWLWALTRNKLADFFRNDSPNAIGGSAFQALLNQVPQEEPDNWSDASGNLCVRRHVREIEAVRASVSAQSWQAFWETAIECRPAAHVAEDLDMTVGAVWAAKCRVLKKLRAEVPDFQESLKKPPGA